MLKYFVPFLQAMLAHATINLLAGIRPTIKSDNPKFLGSNKPDPGCFDSGGISDSYSPLQTWVFDLESPADINTVSIFFKDKSKRPKKTEVRVGYNSDISKNPPCAVSGKQSVIDHGKAWLICGLKGNFVSVTFCGDGDELEISAYSLYWINLRKIFQTSAKFEEDRSSITWVSYSGPPLAP
jgi:hypothetical protein